MDYVFKTATLALLATGFITSSYANTTWKPVIAFAGGISTTSTLGDSKNFPAQNLSTDEFYNYATNHRTQTSGMGDVFLGAEWNVYPQWSLQAGADYNQAAPYSISGSLTQGANVGSENIYSYHYNIQTKQLLALGKLLYTIKGHDKYHPYLLVGLGPSFNKAYNYNTTVPPTLTFTRMYANHTTTSFSYALGVGIDVDVLSYMRMGVGYRFSSLGSVQLGNATIDTNSVSGTLSQPHFYTNEALVQLTFIA